MPVVGALRVPLAVYIVGPCQAARAGAGAAVRCSSAWATVAAPWRAWAPAGGSQPAQCACAGRKRKRCGAGHALEAVARRGLVRCAGHDAGDAAITEVLCELLEQSVALDHAVAIGLDREHGHRVGRIGQARELGAGHGQQQVVEAVRQGRKASQQLARRRARGDEGLDAAIGAQDVDALAAALRDLLELRAALQQGYQVVARTQAEGAGDGTTRRVHHHRLAADLAQSLRQLRDPQCRLLRQQRERQQRDRCLRVQQSAQARGLVEALVKHGPLPPFPAVPAARSAPGPARCRRA